MTQPKSLVKCLLEEQIEFCYTQTSELYGVSKVAIANKQGTFIPAMFIKFCKNKHGIDIVYSSEDEVYMYVKEIK